MSGSRLTAYADRSVLRFVVFGLGRGTDNRKSSETYRPVRDRHERACIKGLRDLTPDLFNNSAVERGSPWSSTSRITPLPEGKSDRPGCELRNLTPGLYPRRKAQDIRFSTRSGQDTEPQPRVRGVR